MGLRVRGSKSVAKSTNRIKKEKRTTTLTARFHVSFHDKPFGSSVRVLYIITSSSSYTVPSGIIVKHLLISTRVVYLRKYAPETSKGSFALHVRS